MEIELKYRADKETGEAILGSDCRLINMRAVYLDTGDGALAAEKLVLRMRKENDEYVATLKWNSGVSASGLHKRGEANVKVDPSFEEEPYIEIFWDTEVYSLLDKAVGGQFANNLGEMVPKKKLVPVCEMDFLRKEKDVELPDGGAAVLSYDFGEIRANGKTAEISEIEIELSKGSEEELVGYGEQLKAEYGLLPGLKSKFARARKLMGGK